MYPLKHRISTVQPVTFGACQEELQHKETDHQNISIVGMAWPPAYLAAICVGPTIGLRIQERVSHRKARECRKATAIAEFPVPWTKIQDPCA
jgi:hypothetical protein